MKILAVKNTYCQNNKESRNSLSNGRTIIYSKADTALLKDGKPFFLPDFMGKCTFTTELVVRISRLGKNIPLEFAHRYYDEVTLGVNIVASEILEKLKKDGEPWDKAVSFDSSAVIGKFISLKDENIKDLSLSTSVNKELVHSFNTGNIATSIDKIIANLSNYYMLRQGDLIFTGTPLNSYELKISQHIDGYLQNQKILSFNIR